MTEVSDVAAADHWVNASGGYAPPGAVVGGRENSGELLYVIRAKMGNAEIPGKLARSFGYALIPYGGEEYRKIDYQVLVGGPNNWVATSGYTIPENAFPGGTTERGETLYIGRVKYSGSITPGKVHPSQGVCYICYDGKELKFSDYEILTSEA